MKTNKPQTKYMVVNSYRANHHIDEWGKLSIHFQWLWIQQISFACCCLPQICPFMMQIHVLVCKTIDREEYFYHMETSVNQLSHLTILIFETEICFISASHWHHCEPNGWQRCIAPSLPLVKLEIRCDMIILPNCKISIMGIKPDVCKD